jgi:hypothetical protein
MRFFKRCLQVVTYVSLAGAASEPLLAQSNNEHAITVKDARQRDAFEIVFSAPNSKTRVGIYMFQGRQADPVPMVYGQVLGAHRRSPGFFEQIVNSADHPVLTVIDGKLTLLNKSTKATHPKSKIVIGHESTAQLSGMPIKDPVSNMGVTLSHIESEDDVSIITRQTDGGDQLVLVSLKQKMSLAGSRGITIAFLANSQQSEDKMAKSFRITEPVVVDYDFYNNDELKRYINTYVGGDFLLGDYLYSPLAVKSLLSKWSGTANNPLFEQWKAHAKGYLDYIAPGSKISPKEWETISKQAHVRKDMPAAQFFLSIPKLNLANLKMSDVASKLQIDKMAQYFEPMSSGFSFAYSGNAQISRQGSILWDPKKAKFQSVYIKSLGGDVASLFALDTAIYLRAQIENRSDGIVDLKSMFDQIGFDPFDPNHTFAYRRVDVDQAQVKNKITDLRNISKAEAYHLLFCSGKNNRGRQVTFVLRIAENHLRFSEDREHTYLPLAGLKFSKDELEMRIISSPEHGVVFDHSTKVMGAKAYQKLKDTQNGNLRFTPYSSLFSTIDKENQVYLRPRRVVPLVKWVEYREYGNPSEKNEKTGIYIEDKLNDLGSDRHVLNGYLIYSLKAKKDNSDELAAKAIIHSQEIAIEQSVAYDNEDLKTRISLAGMLASPAPAGVDSKNTSKFRLLTMIHSHVDGLLSHAEAELPFAFSMVEGVQVFQGLRKKKNSLYVVLFVKKTADFAGGVFVVGYTMTADRTGVHMAAKPEGTNWLTNKMAEKLSSLPKRVAIDTDGGLYWVEDPDVIHHDKRYRVRPFDSPRKIINPADDDTFELNHREVISLESSNGGRVSWYGSKWELTGVSDYRAINGTLNALLEPSDKSKKLAEIKKLESEQPKAMPLYPELDKYLSEELASPDKRGSKRFLVVSEEDYSRFYNLMLAKASVGVGNWHSAALSSSIHLFHFHGKAGTKEIRRELKNAASESGVKVLFAGSDELLEASRLESVKDVAEPTSLLDLDENWNSPGEPISNDDPFSSTGRENKEDKNPDEYEDDEFYEDEGDERNEGDERDLSEIVDLNSRYKKDPNSKFHPTGLFLAATEGLGMKETDLNNGERYDSITTVVLTTPRKLKALELAHPHEFKNGLISDENFSIDTRFLTSPWYTWNPGTSRATKETRQMSISSLAPEDLNVFPNLRDLLGSLAAKGKSPSRTILVVPKNLKDLIIKYTKTHWASRHGVITRGRRGNEGLWNFRNADLRFFQLPHDSDRITQDLVYENLGAMRSLAQDKNHTVVLLSEASAIVKYARPVPAENSVISPFKIMDPAAVRKSELLASSQPVSEISSEGRASRVFPHIMWWLAAEGRRIQPKTTNNWRLINEVEPSFSQLIVATPEEMEDIKKDMGVESTFMNLEEHFNIQELHYPSLEHRSSLLRALFNKDEIRALGYQFSFKGNVAPAENTRDNQVFIKSTDFLASRVEAVANSLEQEPIESFIRAYTFFSRALREDPYLRRNKLIDESYIERFLSKVFPIPLNLKTLEPDDILRQIEDVGKASVDLIKLGHAGQLSLKERVFRMILSQTQGSDSSKQIPASAVFYGKTSLGKTFLFEKIIELLKLKVYDFNRPHEPSAQAFKLVVEDLSEEEAQSNGKNMTVDEALKHLDNFLALPMGYRGFVLIDDLHKAKSAKVLGAIMQYVQNLLNNSMAKVRPLDGKMAIEIPVRNIVLVITINPASSRRVREDYVDKEGSIESRIVAALAQVPGANYEPSVLARISELIDFDEFPREAKASGLIRRIRKRSGENLTLQQRLVLVNPNILSDLAEMFPNAHARNFLQPVTNELFSQVNPDLESAPLYYVTRKVDLSTKGRWHNLFRDESFTPGSVATESSIDTGTLKRKMRDKVVVKPVRFDNIKSRMEFMEYTMSSFRINLFNSLIEASQAHPTMGGNFERRMDFLVPFLGASLHTLGVRPQLAYWDVDVNPTRLGVSQSASQVIELENLFSAKRKENPSPIPVNLTGAAYSNLESLDSFLSSGTTVPKERRQRDVMIDTVERLRAVLQPLHYSFFRSDTFKEVEVEEWLKNLRDNPSSLAQFKKTSEQISAIFVNFISSNGLMDPTLREVVDQQSNDLTIYDMSMLFFMCLDRAITSLAWDSSQSFMMRMLNHITSDPSLASRSEFAKFAFDAEDSPLNPLTIEYITQLLEGNDLITEKSQLLDQAQQHFHDHCEYLFQGGVSDPSNSGDNQ